jgi:hypothetical protein
MRFKSREALVVLVAAFAASMLSASAASAAAPEFAHCVAKTGGKLAAGCGKAGSGYEKEAVPAGSKIAFTTTAGTTVLKGTGNNKMTCQKDKSQGDITGPKTVANVQYTLEECQFEKETAKCSAHSPGKETVEVNILNGELAKVSTTEANTGVGESLKPTTGKSFFTLEGTCEARFSLEGAVIGEVQPLKELKAETGLAYECSSSHTQKIEKFEGGEKEILKSFVLPESSDCFEGKETFHASEPIEVT